MIVLALALSVSATAHKILDRLPTKGNVEAEVVERPAGVTNDRFAMDLLAAEGLESWNGQHPTHSSALSDRLGYKAVWTAKGRNTIVYFDTANEHTTKGKVCRLRADGVGVSRERYVAYRWCGTALGIATPAAPPPPIVRLEKR